MRAAGRKAEGREKEKKAPGPETAVVYAAFCTETGGTKRRNGS